MTIAKDNATAQTLTDARAGRRVLSATSLAHLYHDGATDMHYLLFAIWQQQFGLSMMQIGLLKTLFSGSLAVWQIPAGELGKKFGERKLLIAGTLLLSSALFLYAFSSGIIQLMALIILGGMGASVQHPLASSYISHRFAARQTRLALSTYNFFGDVGKSLIPSAISGLLLIVSWGTSVQVIAALGCVTAAGLRFLLPRKVTGPLSAAPRAAPPAGAAPENALLPEARRKFAFACLCMIGSLDNATRAGTLTFLPFLLAAKGATHAEVGFALTAIFIGGACGKLACGALAPWLGILRTVAVSEALTAGLIIALLFTPLSVSYLLFIPLGIALNGTSSILYGTVAELAKPGQQTRAFSIFYTISLGCGAIMPIAYGALGDHIGIVPALSIVALMLIGVIPLLLPLRIIAK
ncbi:MFS transporter [Acerihabitans arboris]|uniref:MFS transporter n=1 Tax=Acerihabitans arboris TaxID=2691583 RepID=A0A845SGV4_9GAMM|nr:MFS transporter [Acerihabitans arboris]NDL61861.1 MFS transporter [Acerihabitans arboris]